MSKFAQWSEKVNQLQKSTNWVNNKNKKDSQDNRNYTLHIREPQIGMFQYCGQAYAGANNYHKAPDAFLPYLQVALEQKGVEIIDLALELMKVDVNHLAVESEGEVRAMIAQIEKAKQDTQK